MDARAPDNQETVLENQNDHDVLLSIHLGDLKEKRKDTALDQETTDQLTHIDPPSTSLDHPIDHKEDLTLLLPDIPITPLRTILKDITTLSVPLLVISVSDIMVDIIANALIVKLNNKDANAVNLIGSIRALTMLTFSGATLVIGNYTSEEKSKGNLKEIGAIYRQGILVSNIFSIPPIILLLCIENILVSLTIDSEIAYSCQDFFNYFAINVPGNLMLLTAQQSLLGLKNQLAIVFFNLPALGVFYLIGDVLSELYGVKGVAITYIIRSYSLLTAYNLYFLLSSTMKEYELISLTRPRAELYKLRKLIKVILPIIVDNLGDVGSYFILTLITSWLGQKASAAQNVSTQFVLFSITPSLVLAKSAGVLIAEALGRKNYKDVKRYGYVCLTIGILNMLTIATVVLPLAHPVTDLFTPEDKRDKELYDTAFILLTTNSFSEAFDSIHNILTGCLRSLRDTAYPAISNNLSLWVVSVPAAYLFSNTLGMGVQGVVLGNCIGLAATNLPLYYRWHQKSKPEKLHELNEKKESSQRTHTEDKWIVRRCIDRCFFACRKKPKKSTSPSTYQSFINKPSENMTPFQKPSASLMKQEQESSETRLQNKSRCVVM